jgi:fumarate reductase subunit C
MQTFVDLHRNTLSLILDMTLVDQLIAAKGSWLDMSKTLNAVVSSSRLGHHMFSFACEHVTAADVAKIIDESLLLLKDPV